MDHEKKLSFIAKMTKMGLDHIQHMDAGGQIIPATPAAAGVGGALPNQVPAPQTQNSSGIGGVSQFLGLSNGFQASGVPIQPGTTPGQLNAAYTGANNGLTAQTGIANETLPGVTQGLGTESNLAGELANEAAGVGPNPAQAALAQSTGANIAATNAAIAGSRGSNANVGLLARAAAGAGANTQEQAVGQAATLQAQQQIAAQQQAANLAATQVGQGTGAVTTLNQEQQNEQNILQGANTSANNAAVTMQGNINNANAETAAANQNANDKTLGGVTGISALSSLFAKGGMVKMDAGGNVLDAASRAKIPQKDFALPGGRYPIHDENHARNALARVSQYGTPSEKAKVKAAVHKKYPNIGKKMADGGEVSDGSDSPTFDSTPAQDTSSPSVDATPALPQQAQKKGGSGGSILGLIALLANGGKVGTGYLTARKMAGGGYMAPTPLVVGSSGAPQSFVGQWVNSNVTPTGPTSSGNLTLPVNPAAGGGGLGAAAGAVKSFTAKKPSTSSSPNIPDTTGATTGTNAGVDTATDSDPTDSMACGGRLAAKGGGVAANSPKQKATVKGDSLKNDKIPAELSEGEEVIDRETLADPGPIGQMARAVAAHINARNKRGKK